MPVKNAAPFLRECITSILNQSETNWQLIAVNDGSTDESLSILNEFATADKRISVQQNQGKGIIDTLRTAYSFSSGALITRMDADDRMPKDKLMVLKQNLLSRGQGHLAVGLVQYFSDDVLQGGYQYYEAWLNGLTSKGNNYSDIYRECVIPSPCWMAYKEDLDMSGAFNSDTYPEDYDLCFRFYSEGLKPIPCSEVLHHWRDHAARSSRNDPNYADNRFLELKLKWFLKLDYDPTKTLVVWGAASKGKALAKSLIQAQIPFEWRCNNPNKIGKVVYDKLIHNVNSILELEEFQAIIAVANKAEQAEIRAQLSVSQAFFFC